jgi:hypothetical protein
MIVLAFFFSGMAVLLFQQAVEAFKRVYCDWTAILTYKPVKCRYKPHKSYSVIFKA